MEWKFNYIGITNDVHEASIMDVAGVQQIMVDTETLGKTERQYGKNAVLNRHAISDVVKLKNISLKSEIICRINSYNPKTFLEIEEVINSGADSIMIPMINSISDFTKIVDLINGRIKIIPLVETGYSLFKLEEIVDVSRPCQIHFGLNDLHISLGLSNLFEILLSPVFSSTVRFMDKTNVKLLGIGGIGDPLLNHRISPLLLLKKYKSIGGNSTILSRSFFNGKYNAHDIQRKLKMFDDVLSDNSIEDNNLLRDELRRF